MGLNVAQLEKIGEEVFNALPEQVTELLDDVIFVACDTVADANREMQEEFDDAKDNPLPADTKGVFVGDPMEVSSVDGDEEAEDVEYATGFIVLCGENLSDAKEASVVLMHEIGHALGMDETEVAALGLSEIPEPDQPKEPADAKPES